MVFLLGTSITTGVISTHYELSANSFDGYVHVTILTELLLSSFDGYVHDCISNHYELSANSFYGYVHVTILTELLPSSFDGYVHVCIYSLRTFSELICRIRTCKYTHYELSANSFDR